MNIAINGMSAASQGGGSGTEGSDKAFDLNSGSKWLGGSNGVGWIRYDLGEGGGQAVSDYDIISANDVPERDPKDWQFQGSDDGSTWTTLDTQSAQTFSYRFFPKRYHTSNSTAYRYYRLNVTANQGGGTYGIQLSQLALLRPGTLPPPAAAPVGLDATAVSGSRIDSSWPEVSGASGYTVRRSTVSGGPYTVVATNVSGSTYSNTGLAGSTNYFYVVSALGAGGKRQLPAGGCVDDGLARPSEVRRKQRNDRRGLFRKWLEWHAGQRRNLGRGKNQQRREC